MGKRANPVKDEREAQIKKAALRLFSQKGFHHTTISQIAEEAGLGKGTIYWYWRSKEDLAFALVEDMLSAFLEAIKDAEAETGPLMERMSRLIERAVELYGEEKEHCRLLWKFRADRHYIFNPDYVARVTRYYEEMRSLLASMVRQGLREGEVTGIDPELAAMLILGITEGLELAWLENEDFDLRRGLHLVLERFLLSWRADERPPPRA